MVMDEAAYVCCAVERDQKRGSPNRSDQCLQRAGFTAPDCVKKRDPHNNQAIDFNKQEPDP